MKTIKQLKATDEYSLECYFEDGSKRYADIKPYLKSEAFQWLQDIIILIKLKITNILSRGKTRK